MSFDLKRLPDLTPFLARARPLLAAVERESARLQPYLRRADAELRKHPKLAKGVDWIGATWRTLVESFCETIDPFLERFFPDLRLVAVATASDGLELSRITKEGITPLGPIADLDPSIKGELRHAKWSAIELRLRPEQVLQRSLALPGASRDFLGPIIEHRLERLTPWRQDKVLYGYRVTASATDTPGVVNVALAATSKDIVEGLVQRLSDLGLAPTRIGASDGAVDQPIPIPLQTNGTLPARSDSRLMVSRVAMAVLGGMMIVALVTGSIASRAADGQMAVNAKLLRARRLLKAATMADVGGPEKTLIDAKDPDRSMVVLIDRLATAIPEDTFLKELAVTPDKLRLVGSSRNAPALVGKLEAAGLANVRFSSAVTREKDQRDSFEITADRTAGAPSAAADR